MLLTTTPGELCYFLCMIQYFWVLIWVPLFGKKKKKRFNSQKYLDRNTVVKIMVWAELWAELSPSSTSLSDSWRFAWIHCIKQHCRQRLRWETIRPFSLQLFITNVTGERLVHRLRRKVPIHSHSAIWQILVIQIVELFQRHLHLNDVCLNSWPIENDRMVPTNS